MNNIHTPRKGYGLLTAVTLCSLVAANILIQNDIYTKDDVPTVQRIKLTNAALRFIDGVPFGVDATAVHDILVIRKKVRAMQFGDYNSKLNIHIGRYTLDGKKHNIKSFVELEKGYEKEYADKKKALNEKYVNATTFKHAWDQLKAKLEIELEEKLLEQETLAIRRNGNDEQRLLEVKKLKRKAKRAHKDMLEDEQEKLQLKHISNNAAYDKELKVINNEHAKRTAPLRTVLTQVKKEVMEITGPFLEQARSAKEFLMPLMEEWAEKANRPFSPILRWHEEDNGTEVEMFERDVKTFQRVDTFCTDLVDFNESIVYSCPRGYKQFMELINNLKQNI